MKPFKPIARGLLRWRPPAEGGRPTGRPGGEQYASSAVLVLGDGAEVLPGWPDTAERFSIGFNLLPAPQSEWELVEFDFLARDLVLGKLSPGVEILITEGWKIVADLQVTEVLENSGEA